mmetsp:Transcript_21685/g.33104  ORF Transcript_21685/g.33104 Transcript_21685/m.33104 type:complete len:110 (+) Transcript_21685:568-897(+)
MQPEYCWQRHKFFSVSCIHEDDERAQKSITTRRSNKKKPLWLFQNNKLAVAVVVVVESQKKAWDHTNPSRNSNVLSKETRKVKRCFEKPDCIIAVEKTTRHSFQKAEFG